MRLYVTISSRPTKTEQADDEDQDALLGQGEAQDRDRLDVAAGEELVAAAEDEDHGVLQDQGDAEGGQHPGLRRSADHALHHEPADDVGDDDRGQDADDDRHRIGQFEVVDGEPGPEGAEHVIFAVSEVDGAQNAEDHRHADRDDGVDRAGDDPVDDLLEERREHVGLIPVSCVSTWQDTGFRPCRRP